jgi:hypothetical protein
MRRIATEESALRFARATVSEVLLYNELQADWTYEHATEVLSAPIAKARELYESRVADEYLGLFEPQLRELIERELQRVRERKLPTR